ncbi:tetraspanin-11-like [Hermetia illucens]|uniref:tetraspanin-11-like n=1 Tax=Hermetia illucens TaxID=343691 RepID=UPI0018CC3228|nr:tetraspanin-11-like [Hermetia illucens]
MNLTSNFLKILLIIVNIFFALSGIVLIIVAGIVIADMRYFSGLKNDEVRTGAIIILVLGIVILAVALFGLYSVMKKSPRLLKIYGGLILIIFIAEIALVIAFFICKPFFVEKLSDHMHRMIDGNNEEDLKTMDTIQRDLKCCGVESPADWIDQSPTKSLRNSCCVPEHIDASTNDCKDAQPLFKDKYFQVGCLTKLKDYLTMNADLLTYILLGFAIVQIIFIISAFLLASYYEKKSSAQ